MIPCETIPWLAFGLRRVKFYKSFERKDRPIVLSTTIFLRQTFVLTLRIEPSTLLVAYLSRLFHDVFTKFQPTPGENRIR